ncbi:hypothetical protein GOBAR_AA32882 [Gossypium barbadense]|uniref:Raptor N-terminal CASPase-like domain-containing protein n=1 Tax=Gossypium barbadense TaxID=3634 RepID=A0A2P5W9M6_GOSBA|nr:hypothetical protein GOBAR_AA32882 [Gossypium barbadense]
MKTGCVALVLCLNISVDPPDVIKISPCARMECWTDPFSMAPQKAVETIGKSFRDQYEKWQPKICQVREFYVITMDMVFQSQLQMYIPLPISDLDSWLKTPSIYVFDCSAAGMVVSLPSLALFDCFAAGMVVNAFIELLDSGTSNYPGSSRDCILLAACEAHETLPQSAECPADVFTSCLTTPIKMTLRWFCTRSLLHESLDSSLIDKIPGRQNDRKTLLGELNWIFTAVTETIAWKKFFLAERIMLSANCSPISYPMLPPTHQHYMWDAWDMAAEICLSHLPSLVEDPNAEFQVWLSHCHRFHTLVLLGRFLDMGPWAVDLAPSVGIFPYVLKLLQTTTPELRQILVFIWTKILALHLNVQLIRLCVPTDTLLWEDSFREREKPISFSLPVLFVVMLKSPASWVNHFR